MLRTTAKPTAAHQTAIALGNEVAKALRRMAMETIITRRAASHWV